jgi:hypothetical protein
LNAVARLQAVLCQPQGSLYITVHISAGRGGSRATDTRRINSFQKFGNLLHAAGAAKHVPALLVTCHRYRVASKATERTDTGLSGLGVPLAWGHEFGPGGARARRGCPLSLRRPIGVISQIRNPGTCPARCATGSPDMDGARSRSMLAVLQHLAPESN